MKVVVVVISLLLASACGYAQTIDDFISNAYKGMDDFKRSALSDFQTFRNEINANYADFLRGIWREGKAMPDLAPIDEPSPVPPVIISEEDKDKPLVDNPIKIEEEILPPPIIEDRPSPVVPIEETPITPTKPQVGYKFYCFGTPLSVRVSPDYTFKLYNLDGNSLGSAWDFLSKEIFNNLIVDCLKIREEYQLCDWAYLQMLKSLSESLLGKKSNEATLMCAFLYCQSGYRMRLGVDDKKLYLLVGTPHQIYGHGYYTIDGLNYFVFDENPQSILICDAPFEGEKNLSLYIHDQPRLSKSLSTARTITSDRYPTLKIKSQVNKNLMDFYNTYPTSEIGDNVCTRWAMYAETPFSEEVRSGVVNSLKEQLSGLSELDALNRLLNWVQTGFVYEFDDKVWGQDRAFFGEESLYYPYCDCEDRSILFAKLAKEVMGLKAMLVFYPGHLATAIKTNSYAKGDYIQLNGERFIVCDPTYIGAPVGATMPKMDNASAKVIVLN